MISMWNKKKQSKAKECINILHDEKVNPKNAIAIFALG
jgi:hypothetical protein